jgi:hypothetical protein
MQWTERFLNADPLVESLATSLLVETPPVEWVDQSFALLAAVLPNYLLVRWWSTVYLRWWGGRALSRSGMTFCTTAP